MSQCALFSVLLSNWPRARLNLANPVALAPVGAKPGGVVVETSQVTVKVTAVDAKNHKVIFQLPDGTTKRVKVGKKVDLSIVRL